MVDINHSIVKFFSDGYKTRIICDSTDRHDFMFQTSDDRYLEKYWSWENQNDRHEMKLTQEKNVNHKWRELRNEESDLSIIRESIAAMNYNSKYTDIDKSTKEDVEFAIEQSRCIWSRISDELKPEPVPMPSDKDITNLIPFNRLTKYGVTLKRLTHDKIELIRRWRNDPKIYQYMEYREEITPDMQENWFRKIDNVNNFYFIIEVNSKEIGLIDVRDIDYHKGVGEPGIFIWDDDYLNSTFSFCSVLNLTDFCFENLRLKELVIHVLKDNKRAIQFNKAYGYELSPDQEKVYNQEYRISYDKYIEKRKKILKLIN